MTTTLDHLPVERGMRMRGLAMTRLETFADAAFAFAVTLLVIAVDDLPETFEELEHAIKSIPVFLFSSAQLFAFWIAHRNWSRVYGPDNGVAVLLTLLLVMGLLVMVFPLRIVYAFGAADLSGDWVPPPFVLDPVIWAEQLILVFVAYGISWAWLAGVIVAMFAYVLARSRELALNAAERRNAVTFAVMYGVIALSGVSSVTLALTLPHELLHLAGYQYFLLLPLPVVALVLRVRERKRLRDAVEQ